MRMVRPIEKCNVSGFNIKEARLRAGISQAQLACKLQIAGMDLTQNAVSRIELGRRTVADYELSYFADVLKVTVEYLLRPEENIWNE